MLKVLTKREGMKGPARAAKSDCDKNAPGIYHVCKLQEMKPA
jgi:hypothetical protein